VCPDVHCLVVESEDTAGVVQPRPLHLKTEEEDGGWRPRRRRRRRRPRGRGKRWREGEGGSGGLDDGTIMCEPDDRLTQRHCNAAKARKGGIRGEAGGGGRRTIAIVC
jgi:hypothetical protein